MSKGSGIKQIGIDLWRIDSQMGFSVTKIKQGVWKCEHGAGYIITYTESGGMRKFIQDFIAQNKAKGLGS